MQEAWAVRAPLKAIGAIAFLTLGLGSCDRSITPSSPLSQSSPSLPSLSPVTATPPPVLSPPSAAERAAANTFRQIGLDYRNQGLYDEAIAALQKSVELDPNELSGRVILGWTLHLAGQETEATHQLKQALAQQPNDVSALNALGIVYLVSGDLNAAVQTHQQAVALQPDNEIGYFNLSLAYHRLNRSADAIANARRATQLEPENPNPWLALAIAHWDNNELTLAQEAYQQAIRQNAQYDSAAILDQLKFSGFSQKQIQLTETIQQSR
ncbi:MAG: tetratricopeptide repeat protein [Leptolyngbyaceae cyanobacterium CSU_1_4]|nr:tetratricopeptide repeat protein [Leptolyngbyaceae cyanobacterium CSU_1_4]